MAESEEGLDPDEVPLRPGFLVATDPGFDTDYYGRWNQLRNETPIFRSDATDAWNIWYLLDYDHAQDGLRNFELFSNRSIAPANLGEPPRAKHIPVELDPPEHTKYRQLLNPAFAPGKVAELEPHIRERATDLIDQFINDGACDFVPAFAGQFPTSIFLEMLGLPVEETDRFAVWVHEVMHLSQDNPARLVEAIQEVQAYLGDLIDERRAQPRDDVISYLLACEVDGRSLNPDEILRIAFLLFLAGLDTVAGTLGLVFQHLARNDVDRRAVIEHPELIDSAVEEFLRLYSIAAMPRILREDVDYAGCPMRAEDRIVASTQAANRDPAHFDNPDQFVIDRHPNRHIAFGSGVHRCLGSNLARLELKVAIEEWHKRIPEYRIADGAVCNVYKSTTAGLDTLPLVWPVAGGSG